MQLSVQTDALTYSYAPSEADEERPLYEDFALAIESGSTVAILGASGSGKSTLGRLLARMLQPQLGAVRWSSELRSHHDLVYVDQQPMNSVFPWQTVRRNLEYPLRKLGWVPEDAAGRADHLLSLFHLESLADKYPAHISGGELQRLSLARCLSWRPKVVVLDEVFSALDSVTRTKIISVLRQIQGEDSPTFILITHNLQDALALATRCIVLGERPVRVLLDLAIDRSGPDSIDPHRFVVAQEALIDAIRNGYI